MRNNIFKKEKKKKDKKKLGYKRPKMSKKRIKGGGDEGKGTNKKVFLQFVLKS